ncbi:MAG: helix-turn-helix transcriptional regulator [Firmicutes bacterium]|nr:helix-turn-helix transcriptional regulator [Bacillota bacterium]
MNFYEKVFKGDDSHGQRKIYIYILLGLIICAVVTLFISSLVFYINFERITMELVHSGNIANLEQAARAVSIISRFQSSAELIYQVIDPAKKGQGDTLVIDTNGKLLCRKDTLTAGTDLKKTSYIQRILANPAASGCFVDTVNGAKSMVSYTAPDSLGRRYIRITPLAAILKKINITRVRTVLIILGIFICGLLAAYLISKQLYRPISRMLSDYQDLETAKKSSDLAVKHEFLRNIILGHGGSILDFQSPEYQNLPIQIIPDNPTWLLLLKIDQFVDFSLKYKPEEKSFIKNALIYLTGEIFGPSFNTEAVDSGNDQLAFILNAKSKTVELEPAALTGQIRKAQATILDSLKISVSVIISSRDENAFHLNALYNQVAEASLHRLFFGRGCVIFAEKIAAYKSKEYVYPANKEKILVDALMSGNIGEAKKIYLEIVRETGEYPFAAFNLAISHLIITINGALNIIQKNNALDQPELRIASGIFNELETIEEINLYFFILFESVKELLDKKKSSKHEQLVKKIQEIVDEAYVNPDLSVDNIATALELTPSYICRVYKQLTLNTILDYIMEVRMSKAKELLLQTKLPVAEIAEKVGFANSSYFYKTFKKMNGVTPTEFRSS